MGEVGAVQGAKGGGVLRQLRAREARARRRAAPTLVLSRSLVGGQVRARFVARWRCNAVMAFSGTLDPALQPSYSYTATCIKATHYSRPVRHILPLARSCSTAYSLFSEYIVLFSHDRLRLGGSVGPTEARTTIRLVNTEDIKTSSSGALGSLHPANMVWAPITMRRIVPHGHRPRAASQAAPRRERTLTRSTTKLRFGRKPNLRASQQARLPAEIQLERIALICGARDKVASLNLGCQPRTSPEEAAAGVVGDVWLAGEPITPPRVRWCALYPMGLRIPLASPAGRVERRQLVDVYVCVRSKPTVTPVGTKAKLAVIATEEMTAIVEETDGASGAGAH
eukprot:scaffold257569_cov32-Tisochrysis_lutea.AAC.3